MPRPPESDLSSVTTLLCDADGTLFPSEEPAFEASARVVNDVMAALGLRLSFTGDELRRTSSGRNFRALVTDLAREHGRTVPPEALERWVRVEVDVVTDHLRGTLRPDPAVLDALTRLRPQHALALVSSSALRRLAVCLDATDLAPFFPGSSRFSAQDSLPVPTSKPDPCVYVHAGEVLGLRPEQGLAVEDAVAGVVSAREAGCPVIGIVAFVPPGERETRAEELLAAGAVGVVDSWDELVQLLDAVPARRGAVEAR